MRTSPMSRTLRWTWLGSEKPFAQFEFAAYLVVGVLLAITTIIAIAEAAVMLWHALWDWSGADVFELIDQLFFILLLMEILHTIRASTRLGGLSAESFLIVGLIAAIRRVLAITLHVSHGAAAGSMEPEAIQQFRGSMIELGVLCGLILILVGSIVLLRRSGGRRAAAVRAEAAHGLPLTGE